MPGDYNSLLREVITATTSRRLSAAAIALEELFTERDTTIAAQAARIDDLQGQIATAHRVYGDEIENLRLENGVRLERIQTQAARMAQLEELAGEGIQAEFKLRKEAEAQAARIKELEMEAVLRNGAVKDDQRIIAALTAERDHDAERRHELASTLASSLAGVSGFVPGKANEAVIEVLDYLRR